MMPPPTQIVVADANVLINLLHVGRLELCSQLPHLRFVVPDHVREEVTDPDQRAELDHAFEQGHFQLAELSELSDLAMFADLTTHLGRGEAACLVLAARHGWTIASDEKGRFRREATAKLGEGCLLGTPDLYRLAIQAGALTVAEADADKVALEAHRFRMPFDSFSQLP